MSVKFVVCDDIPRVTRTIKDMLINELSLEDKDVVCFNFTDYLLNFLRNNSCDNIIIDLAMDSTGLPQKEREDCKSSTLTGWIFIKNYIINGEFKDKLKNTNIYIFSGYGNILSKELGINVENDRFDIDSLCKELSNYGDNIHFFKKKGIYGGIDKMIDSFIGS